MSVIRAFMTDKELFRIRGLSKRPDISTLIIPGVNSVGNSFDLEKVPANPLLCFLILVVANYFIVRSRYVLRFYVSTMTKYDRINLAAEVSLDRGFPEVDVIFVIRAVSAYMELVWRSRVLGERPASSSLIVPGVNSIGNSFDSDIVPAILWFESHEVANILIVRRCDIRFYVSTMTIFDRVNLAVVVSLERGFLEVGVVVIRAVSAYIELVWMSRVLGERPAYSSLICPGVNSVGFSFDIDIVPVILWVDSREVANYRIVGIEGSYLFFFGFFGFFFFFDWVDGQFLFYW